MLLALLLAAQPVEPAPPAADEIVVTAVRGKCRVTFADKPLSGGAFDRKAREWAAGKAVRVIEPRGADQACRTKIAFNLARRGVRLIQFVDPPEIP